MQHWRKRMSDKLSQYGSIVWLLIKLGVFVLISMEAAEIVVIAYQRF
jgi:hypothetical protein